MCTCIEIDQNKCSAIHWVNELISTLFMPRCTVHRRHTVPVVRSCVGLSVRWFLGFSVCQILHIFVSGELQVLKVGQYAKNDILVR